MEATPLIPHPDQLIHIRTILGVVMGLSLTRLLTGLARLVQNPNSQRIYLVHLGWVLFLFAAVIHFWWFEFALGRVARWTFEFYLFEICYAALFFFICTILFPDHTEEHDDIAEYFHSRQKWFFGLLAALFTIDVIDTLWKGEAHFHTLGLAYPLRQSIMASLFLVAMFVQNRVFHGLLVAITLILQFQWILRHYQFLS